MRRSSIGDHPRQSAQLLRREEGVNGHGYGLSRNITLFYRSIPRKLAYVVCGFFALLLLAALSTRTSYINPFPLLDTVSDAVRVSQDSRTKQSYRKALVIASYKAQDVSWMKELHSDLTSGWQIFRYVGDAPKPGKNYLTLPSSDGREGLAYLTFIVDHYDNLPDYAVFVHGHDR